MKKRVLITGSSGFLGQNFINKFKNKYEFIKYDKKLKQDLKKIYSYPNVDIVLHLAAFNSTKDFYLKPYQVIEENIIPTYNLINFYKKNKKKPIFVYTGTPESASGSVELYNYKIPTDEKVPAVIPDLFNPRWSYSSSKSVSEMMVINSGLNFIIIRPHNIYGKNQRNHFIPEFINKCKKKKNVELNGWKNTRSWMYIDDFCQALDLVITNKKSVGEIINIGSNFEHSVLKVAKEIIQIFFPNKNIKLIKKKSPKGSVMRRMADITKLKKITNWEPSINIREGLGKFYEKN